MTFELGEPVTRLACLQLPGVGAPAIVHTGGPVPLGADMHPLSLLVDDRAATHMLVSDIVDIAVVGTTPWPQGVHERAHVAVLCADRVVVFALADAGQRCQLRPAALANTLGLHTGALATCTRLVAPVPRALRAGLRWVQRRLDEAGGGPGGGNGGPALPAPPLLVPWPVLGGRAVAMPAAGAGASAPVAVVGYDDGSVAFWDTVTGQFFCFFYILGCRVGCCVGRPGAGLTFPS